MMQSDWHPTDIIAGLKKRGTSLSGAFPSGRAGVFYAGKCAYPPLA